MGWGRYLLLGDLGQQLDLADQKAEMERMRREMQVSRGSSPQTDARVARLEAENDELRLYLAAVLRLLKNKGVVTADEIKRMVEVLDAQDGAADGKYDGPMG